MRMPTVARLLSLLPLAVLAACAAAATVAPPPSGGSAGPLVSSLQVQTYADSVRFVLQVTNASGAALPVTFPSGQSADFTVSRDGRELWRWSADRGFTQAVRQETLAPGETRTFEASWNPPAGTTGQLVARAVLTSSDQRVQQASYFSLP